MASFLDNYLLYTSGSEPHQTYRRWCGLSALSVLASRKIWTKLGDYQRIFPNLYVVMDGDPGDRKSTARNQAVKMVNACGCGSIFAPDSVTRERILEVWPKKQAYAQPYGHDKVTYTPLAIFANEMAEFLGYNSEGMIGFLTALYDYDEENFTVETKNKGNSTIIGPYLSLLGCCTPAWVKARLRDDVISGGFSRRVVWIYQPGPIDPKAIPIKTEAMHKAEQDTIDYGKKLAKISGELKITSDTIKFYTNWYEDRINGLVIPLDKNTCGYFASKHIQAFKVAMLISMSESPELVLEKHHFVEALDYLADIERLLPKVFTGMGKNPLNEVASDVVDAMQHTVEGLTLGEITGLSFKNADTEGILEVVQYLIGTGMAKNVDGKITLTKTGKTAAI